MKPCFTKTSEFKVTTLQELIHISHHTTTIQQNGAFLIEYFKKEFVALCSYRIVQTMTLEIIYYVV